MAKKFNVSGVIHVKFNETVIADNEEDARGMIFELANESIDVGFIDDIDTDIWESKDA